MDVSKLSVHFQGCQAARHRRIGNLPINARGWPVDRPHFETDSSPEDSDGGTVSSAARCYSGPVGEYLIVIPPVGFRQLEQPSALPNPTTLRVRPVAGSDR